MRILFVSHQIYPCFFGGTEVFNYHLSRELARDNEVTLFTYCDRAAEGVRLVRVNRVRPTRYLTPLKLANYIIRHRSEIDVVFLSYSRSHWFEWSLFPILRKLTGIPYVITIHGGGLTPWKPFFLYDWCFRNASALVGISERICAEYRKRTGLEVKYVPPLFPFTRSERSPDEIRDGYGIPRGARVILSVGSLKELKSPGTLVEAFNLLEEDFVTAGNLFLVFAGDGPLREELQKESKYGDRTIFLGNVPREEMPDLYGIAALYAIASRFEGTPLSLLEAVFNGVPVIGSNAPGINAIIEDGRSGILFEPGDGAALASGIRKLLSGGKMVESYVDEAMKKYERDYSYGMVLEAYREIFDEATHEK